MKQLIFIVALLAANIASADVKPEDIFGGILDIIVDNIDKDNGNDFSYGPGVILQDVGNNRIALGRIRLHEVDDSGSFVLPKCNMSPNEPVSALRFRIDKSAAYVKNVRIVYQNGDKENVQVDELYEANTASDWYYVDTGSRCVKSITVKGSSVYNDFGWGNGSDDHVGWDNDGGWDNGGHGGWNNQFDLGPVKGFKKGPQFPGHGGGGFPHPGHPGWGKPVKQEPTVLTFIGLKANNNGF